MAIFGCGNTLLGDDGFGPAVVEALQQAGLSQKVLAVDAGTGVREFLLDYLMLPSLRPGLLIVVDTANEAGAVPGEIRVRGPEAVACRKIHDFSLHQFPTVNLLSELQAETGVQVILVTAQSAVAVDALAEGLSPVMAEAVAEACLTIQHLVHRHVNNEATVL